MVNKINQDVYVGVIILIGAIYLFSSTSQLPTEAALFPRGILILLMGFAVLISLKGIKKTRKYRTTDSNQYTGEESKLTLSLLAKPLLAFLLILFYVTSISIIGFFLATFLFVLAYLWFSGVKKWSAYVFTSIGLNVFIYVLFVMQLNVQLPTGLLFR